MTNDQLAHFVTTAVFGRAGQGDPGACRRIAFMLPDSAPNGEFEQGGMTREEFHQFILDELKSPQYGKLPPAPKPTSDALVPNEPKPAMLLRLLAEAQLGKLCDVSIPEALEFRRDQYGLERREFAAVLGMHAGHYSEVTTGVRPMPLNARIRAYALGVPAEVLLQPGTEMKMPTPRKERKS